MEVIFLGTGSSTEALKAGPLESPNWRSNPSIVVRLPNKRHAYGCSNILVDCGKTFHEAMLRWFPRRHIRTVDAVVLTHEHADAIFGLDDLRGLQPYTLKSKPADGQNVDYLSGFDSIRPMPLYLNEHTFQTVQRAFPYLIQPPDNSSKVQCGIISWLRASNQSDPEAQGAGHEFFFFQVWRRVAKIAFEVFQEDAEFQPVDSLPCTFTPLPVEHGADYISMGFLIKFNPCKASDQSPETLDGERNLVQVAYISDVSKIPDETYAIIHSAAASSPIDLLILDTLTGEDKVHQTHFNIADAVVAANAIRPRRCYLVGMSHAIDHEHGNHWLKSKNLEFPMELAYDGLTISVPDKQ